MSTLTFPQPAAGKRVTVKDVAAQAGVSHSMVCIVLNGAKSGNTGVAESTRARILAAAEELGYRRNGSMGSARSGRFNALGLLLASEGNRSNLPPELLQGISDEMRQRDLHLILQQLPDEKLTDEKFVPKMLREWMCDGLLIDYTHQIPPRLLELIHQTHTPAIWMNTKLPADCVYPDELAAGRKAAEYMVGLGHRCIVYSSHQDNYPRGDYHFSVAERREGCRRGVEAASLEFQQFSPLEELPYNQRVAQWVEKLRAPSRPTAIVTYGGLDCEVVLRAAELVGLKVPEDLSVIIFAGSPYSVHGQRVTNMQIPLSEMGHAAVQQLLRKIEEPQKELPPLALPMELIEGQTCARAPKSF